MTQRHPEDPAPPWGDRCRLPSGYFDERESADSTTDEPRPRRPADPVLDEAAAHKAARDRRRVIDNRRAHYYRGRRL